MISILLLECTRNPMLKIFSAGKSLKRNCEFLQHSETSASNLRSLYWVVTSRFRRMIFILHSFWCNILICQLPHFPVHLRGILYNTQMEYPFLNAPGVTSTSFSMYCATQWAYRIGPSVYINAGGVVEYCASQNATPICFARKFTLPQHGRGSTACNSFLTVYSLDSNKVNQKVSNFKLVAFCALPWEDCWNSKEYLSGNDRVTNHTHYGREPHYVQSCNVTPSHSTQTKRRTATEWPTIHSMRTTTPCRGNQSKENTSKNLESQFSQFLLLICSSMRSVWSECKYTGFLLPWGHLYCDQFSNFHLPWLTAT